MSQIKTVLLFVVAMTAQTSFGKVCEETTKIAAVLCSGISANVEGASSHFDNRVDTSMAGVAQATQLLDQCNVAWLKCLKTCKEEYKTAQDPEELKSIMEAGERCAVDIAQDRHMIHRAAIEAQALNAGANAGQKAVNERPRRKPAQQAYSSGWTNL